MKAELFKQNEGINDLTKIIQSLKQKSISIINTNLPQSIQIILNSLDQNQYTNIFVSTRDVQTKTLPIRSLINFQQEMQKLSLQKQVYLTHQQLLDIKFREVTPFITNNTVLIIDNAEFLIDSCREAFSMHLTNSLIDRCVTYVQVLSTQISDFILSDPCKSVINIENFDFEKETHQNAFFSIMFRNSSYQLPFLPQPFIPKLSALHFLFTIIRVSSALSELLLSEQDIIIPEIFLKRLTEKYSVDLVVLQYSVQYYHNLISIQKLQPFQPLITILQFIQLVSTFSNPLIHYKIETSSQTNDQKFFESNSFQLVIQKGLNGKLHKSKGVLQYLCTDPLVAMRFILERFSTIIFVSNQMPTIVDKSKIKEKLSQQLRINYFNRKSQLSFTTKFYDIQVDIFGFYRYQRKGADQTLLSSKEKDISPSLALNYQKFIQQRSTQSRDGVVIFTPNKTFSARLIQRLRDQNLSISTIQSAFIVSPDQIESKSVKKFYKLSCNIGRGGILLSNFKDTHNAEFTAQYNSISLVLGIPFPQKSLKNKLLTFYDYRIFDKNPEDLWYELAARNIITAVCGQTALILADMRFNEKIAESFPNWFSNYLQEESAGCLQELKNWVIHKNE